MEKQQGGGQPDEMSDRDSEEDVVQCIKGELTVRAKFEHCVSTDSAGRLQHDASIFVSVSPEVQ